MANFNLQDAEQPEIFDMNLSSNYSSPSMLSVTTIDVFDCDLYSSAESDISLLIMEDENFVQSIMAAKDQMRNGETYLSYEDVFGD